MGISPPITWFGGKAKLASRIVGHFPAHHTYVEAFGGSAAVLLAKPPARIEVYNDIDRDLLNLFRVLRDPALYRQLKQSCETTLYSRGEFELAGEPCDDLVEAARRFIVRQRQSHSGLGKRWSYCIEDTQGGTSSAVRRWHSGIERLPAIHSRLRNVQIEGDDWRAILRRYDSKNTLFYLDPPYAAETRVGGSYRHEFSAVDHQALVGELLILKGMVILSGYCCEPYEELVAAGWKRIDYDVPAYSSRNRERRQESLWLSPTAVTHSPMAEMEAFPSAVQSMRQGAYLTHQLRVGATEAKLLRIINAMRSAGEKLTLTAIARRAEMSREHLGRRYRHLIATG